MLGGRQSDYKSPDDWLAGHNNGCEVGCRDLKEAAAVDG